MGQAHRCLRRAKVELFDLSSDIITIAMFVTSAIFTIMRRGRDR
jgi:hypothetical protein